jgi:hypothetical protein
MPPLQSCVRYFFYRKLLAGRLPDILIEEIKRAKKCKPKKYNERPKREIALKHFFFNLCNQDCLR